MTYTPGQSGARDPDEFDGAPRRAARAAPDSPQRNEIRGGAAGRLFALDQSWRRFAPA